MSGPTTPPAAPPPTRVGVRRTVRLHLWQVGATWVVQNALASGYRLATGRPAPTARDSGISLRKVATWAALTAAAVAATNVAVDRIVLRQAAD